MAGLDVLLDRVRVVVLQHVLAVGLVHHADDVFGQRVHERAQLVARDVRARRVVRIAHVDHARLRRDRREQRVEIVRVVGERHLDRVGLLPLRGQRIRDERGPGEDDVVAGAEEGGGEVADRHVRARARRDHVGGEAVRGGEGGMELAGVGVAIQLRRRGAHRGEGGGCRPLSALVRRELRDRDPLGDAAGRAGCVDGQLAEVGAEADAGGCAGDDGLAHGWERTGVSAARRSIRAPVR